MNLYDTSKDKTYKIKRITGGRQFKSKLESMGILVNTTVTRINSEVRGGPVVIKVGNSQYALGRGMASRIQVEKINNG
ncbi:MAG TPA: FeoA family protein [bacterium]|nr:FeoA family protein [bacterium]